jgi:hypothetical protein
MKKLFTAEDMLKKTYGIWSKRAFRLCWGQLERLKPRKKIFETGLSWIKENLDFSFLSSYGFK